MLWARTKGDPQVRIAILDGPVDLDHPSLAPAQITVLDLFGRGSVESTLEYEHGTHVASLVFGAHDSEAKGVAPGCRGLLIPIYGGPVGLASCTQAELASAIYAAVDHDADVVNVSGGQPSVGPDADRELRAAVRYCCVERGRLLVAAAGNDGCEDCLHVPGSMNAVLAVGSMDSREQPLASSNWGETYRFQGVLAPGYRIIGARPGGGVHPASGTSFATPIVAGVAGLLLSLQRRLGQEPNPLVVREFILRGARGCKPADAEGTDCDRVLRGRLDINGALSFLPERVITGVLQTQESPSWMIT